MQTTRGQITWPVERGLTKSSAFRVKGLLAASERGQCKSHHVVPYEGGPELVEG